MNQSTKTNQTTENIKDIFVTVYLNDIVKALQRFWWVCVAAAVLFGGYSALSQRLDYVPQYESSVTLTVNTQNAVAAVNGVSVYSFYYDATTASLLSTTFPYILNSSLLQEAIKEDLGLPSIPAKLSAEAVSGTNMFTLTSTSQNPQFAHSILLAALDNYPSVAKHVIGNITFEILKQPIVPTEPINKPNYINEALKGVVIGLFFGLLFIFVYILQRKTIKTKNDIKTHLTLDSLAVIPQVTFKKRAMPGDKSLLFTNPDIGSGFPESFRVLRNVFVSSLNENEKIVMTTSSVPGEGKTTLATNLALALADHGKNILLVDGDIRHPSVAPLLGIDHEAIEYETVTDLYKIAYLEKYKLRILLPVTNEEEKTEYFSSENIKKMFDELRDSYDYILVDTPPCGLISDALFIAQYADAAIFVTYQDAVRISRVKNTLDGLMSTDIHILGCVLNGAISGFAGYGYGKYGYGYGGYGEEKGKHHRRSKHRRKHSSKAVPAETPINETVKEAKPIVEVEKEEEKTEQSKPEVSKETKSKKNKKNKKKKPAEPVIENAVAEETETANEETAPAEETNTDSKADESSNAKTDEEVKAEAVEETSETEDNAETPEEKGEDSAESEEKKAEESVEAAEETKESETETSEEESADQKDEAAEYEATEEEDSENFSVFD